MQDPHEWEQADIELLHDCGIFELQQVQSRGPLGQVRPFVRIHCGDWVNVVPVTPDGHVVMVRQFRHGSQTTTLEIPGGMVDPGEEAEDAARRELREETGYEAKRLQFIGAVNPNPAVFDNKLHTYLAHGAVRMGDVSNVGDEETVVQLVPVADIATRVRQGDVDHALVLSALYLHSISE